MLSSTEFMVLFCTYPAFYIFVGSSIRAPAETNAVSKRFAVNGTRFLFLIHAIICAIASRYSSDNIAVTVYVSEWAVGWFKMQMMKDFRCICVVLSSKIVEYMNIFLADKPWNAYIRASFIMQSLLGSITVTSRL